MKFKRNQSDQCEIRNKYAEPLLEGIFVDKEGFGIDNPRLVTKLFKTKEDGKYAVLIWNPSKTEEENFNLTVPGYKLMCAHTIEEDTEKMPKKIGPQKVIALIYTVQYVYLGPPSNRLEMEPVLCT